MTTSINLVITELEYLSTPYHITSYLPLQSSSPLLEKGRLVVLIRPSQVNILQLDQDNRILGSRLVVNSERLASSLFLRFVFEKEQALSLRYGSYEMVSSSRSFMLLPTAFGRKNLHSKYASVLLEESVYEDEVYFNEINGMDAGSLFLSPPFVTHILKEHLADFEFCHISSILFKMQKFLAQQSPDHICLYTLDELALICVSKQSKLMLCNAFEYQVDAGAMYFIQSVSNMHEISLDDVPVFLMGDIDSKSSLYTHLKERIPQLQFPLALRTLIPNDEIDIPFWKFAYLAV